MAYTLKMIHRFKLSWIFIHDEWTNERIKREVKICAREMLDFFYYFYFRYAHFVGILYTRRLLVNNWAFVGSWLNTGRMLYMNVRISSGEWMRCLSIYEIEHLEWNIKGIHRIECNNTILSKEYIILNFDRNRASTARLMKRCVVIEWKGEWEIDGKIRQRKKEGER